jgi:Tfp pilus assembly protein PilW
MRTRSTLNFGLGAFTLMEVMVSTALASAITLAILTTGMSITRSSFAAEDYSYQTNEQNRAVDYITRDIRRALTVTIPAGGQTLSVTIPDVYPGYDAQGLPTGPLTDPVISKGVPTYGNATKPLVVTYYVSGSSLIRQQKVQSTGKTTELVVANKVNDMQLRLVPLSTVVNYSITFAPHRTSGGSHLSPGTVVSGTAAARTIRFSVN